VRWFRPGSLRCESEAPQSGVCFGVGANYSNLLALTRPIEVPLKDFSRNRISADFASPVNFNYELENPVLSLLRALVVCPAERALSGRKRSRRDWLRQTSRLALGIPLSILPASEMAGSASPLSAPFPRCSAAIPRNIDSRWRKTAFWNRSNGLVFNFFGTKRMLTPVW
jgi:hypothetical protein